MNTIAKKLSATLDVSKIATLAGALMLGSFMFYGVAFAHMDVAHNAAHDGRHVFAFPCH